jgi:3-oxoacyl-[acyl-carrier protein] reductase
MDSSKPKGKIAIVTGASRGIGAAVALALARRGIASVLAVRDPQSAEQTVRSVRSLGVPCRAEACDVADEAMVGRMVGEVLATWGRLDILVNNAGQIEPIGHVADTGSEAWKRAIEVNLIGPYHLIRASLPYMLEGGGGVVLNVSSGAAHAPREGWSAYCSAKAGLYMLARCTAAEYASRGIAVYSLQPGLVDTDMQGRIRASGMNEISRVPKEKLAPPERSAGLIAWLADTVPADLAAQDLSVNDAGLCARAGIA